MTFGFLVFPEVEELDLIGPWEMIGMWGMRFGGPEQRLMVAQSPAPVVCAKGLAIVPHVSCERCPPLDALLVPGGQGTRREVDNPALIAFIAAQARSGAAILSVCTGAFLLHQAGLLSGKRATTHWHSLDRLRALEEVKVIEERIVRDGSIWSAAGVSAGIDLALAYIAAVAGEETAGQVQFATEYYPATTRYGSAHGGAAAPRYLRHPAATH